MKFYKFIFVGGCAAALQIITLSVCLQGFGFANQISCMVAYIVSVIFHYFFNRYFTFQVTKKLNIKEIMRYLSIVVLNLVITLTVTTLTVNTLQLNAYIGTIFSIMTTVSIAFFSSKHWIFNHQEGDSSANVVIK